MRIAFGADHAGVDLKNQLRDRLESQGFSCHDFGTTTHESVDYPDLAARVGHAVASGECDRGILVCGSGLGMAIAANKIPGVRAIAVGDETSARLGREHNDATILAIGARLTPAPLAALLVDVFLSTPFAGGRHQRRLDKIAALDHTHQ